MKRKFAVDVHWTVARSFEVEADSREEAKRIMEKRIAKGEVNVWRDGFEATDDMEASVSGEEGVNGEIEYY